MRNVIWTAALAATLTACIPGGGTDDAGTVPAEDGGPMADGSSTADSAVVVDGGTTPIGDGGPVGACAMECLETSAMCGSTEGIDCGGLCASYINLGPDCTSEREAYFRCGRDTCDTCMEYQDAIVSCIVDTSDHPCLAYCRAANAAGCAYGHGPEGHQDCNCIAAYYSGGLGRCMAESNALFACQTEHPCDRASSCADESDALNTCGLGCASGQVGCYVGPTGRCVDESALATDPENCGRCNNRCGGLGTCIAGACACASGSHFCADVGCVADTDPAACGASCTVCAAPEHGLATCEAGACGITCDAGYRAEAGACVPDCIAGEHACGDGCFPDDDPTACGASCDSCTTSLPHAIPACNAGACGFRCRADYALVDGSCVCPAGRHMCGDGCYPNDDTATCGSWCTPCPAPPLDAHATCVAGACGWACDASYVRVGSQCLRCDPFTGAGCTAPQSCYLGRFAGTFQCATPSSAPRWPCYEPNDCEAGYACLGPGPAGSCYRVCDTSVTGTCDPFAGEVCRMVSYGVPNLGVCVR